MALERFALVLGSVLTTWGCAGHASKNSGGGAGAGAGGGNGSSAMAGAGGVSTPSLRPEADPPRPEGDDRLPDLGDAHAGDGWDLCGGEPGLTSTRYAPCAECPPATRGNAFLTVGSVAEATHSLDTLQAYFYFDPPARADALWFDAMWINGTPTGQFSLVPTDLVCQPMGEQRVYDVAGLFAGVGEWVTTCVPLTDFEQFSGLGFRFDVNGTLGLDAFRFGPACPAR